jgi:hypothetical protein
MRFSPSRANSLGTCNGVSFSGIGLQFLNAIFDNANVSAIFHAH